MLISRGNLSLALAVKDMVDVKEEKKLPAAMHVYMISRHSKANVIRNVFNCQSSIGLTISRAVCRWVCTDEGKARNK